MAMRRGFGVRELMARWCRPLIRLKRDDSGATAVEFAIVATPFFGIIGVCIFQFTSSSLDNAVDQASRTLRTGAYASSTSADSTTGLNNSDFKKLVCAKSPAFIDCGSKVKVFIVPETSFAAAATKPSCGSAEGGGSTKISIGRSSIILVVVCYESDLMKTLPFLNMSNDPTKPGMIISTTVFRTEP
jgi:Flp pilus assembly protein TadG